MKLDSRKKHLRIPHKIVNMKAVGNYCGKRLVTVFSRCIGPQCGGVLVNIEQYRVRKDHHAMDT